MPGKSPEVPARYYARLCELLGQDGVNVAALLRAARIRPAVVKAPDSVLRLNQVEALLDEVFRLTQRRDQSHDLGRALKLSSHSIVGYGMLSSPTVGYAMTLAARYFRLIMPSFRSLSNRTRHEKALEFLEDDRLTVTHIAHELGYTDMSNFARSFRREAGVAPGDYRNRRTGRAGLPIR